MGHLFHNNIAFSSASDLAEEVYKYKKEYSLVFHGLKGAFTDSGVFDFLEHHPHVIRIYANETKTFYIHVIPSLFGSFRIYLSNKTSFGEVLSYIDNHIITGALISWFERNFNELNYSTTSINEEPITLNEIFKKIHADESPVNNLQTYENSSSRHNNKNSSLNLDSLFQIHEILGKNDLSYTIQVATLQNKLQAFRSVSTEDFIGIFKFYSEMNHRIHHDYIRNATLFTMLSGIDAQDMMNISDEFQLFNKSSYGRFLNRALLLQFIFTEIESLRNNTQKRLNVRQTLIQINDDYKQFEETYTADNSISRKDLQRAYLAALLKNEGKASRTAIDNALHDIQLIKELLDNYKEDTYTLPTTEDTIHSLPHSMTTRKDEDNHDRLLLIGYAWDTPIRSLINPFHRILQNAEDSETALLLLRGVQLGYFPNDIIELFESANNFFTNEGVNSVGIADLFISGLAIDLQPEQVMSSYKEVSSRLHTNHTLVVDFISSTINLNARPYTEVIFSNGIAQAVKYDTNGTMQPVPMLHVKNYFMLQFVNWIWDL